MGIHAVKNTSGLNRFQDNQSAGKRQEVFSGKKRCPKCGQSKPTSEFYKSKKGRSGLRSDCRDCSRQIVNKIRHRYSQESRNCIPKYKRCAKCKIVKPESEFHRYSYSCDGLASYCRTCRHIAHCHEKEQYPERRVARKLVELAIKSGKLKRQPCQMCGSTTARIEGHHDDYQKPLEVRWLCRQHHAELHNRQILPGALKPFHAGRELEGLSNE